MYNDTVYSAKVVLKSFQHPWLLQFIYCILFANKKPIFHTLRYNYFPISSISTHCLPCFNSVLCIYYRSYLLVPGPCNVSTWGKIKIKPEFEVSVRCWLKYISHCVLIALMCCSGWSQFETSQSVLLSYI